MKTESSTESNSQKKKCNRRCSKLRLLFLSQSTEVASPVGRFGAREQDLFRKCQHITHRLRTYSRGRLCIGRSRRYIKQDFCLMASKARILCSKNTCAHFAYGSLHDVSIKISPVRRTFPPNYPVGERTRAFFFPIRRIYKKSGTV